MKTIGIIIFIAIMLPAFALIGNANEVDNQIMSSIESDLNNFQSSLPKNVQEFFPSEVFNGDFSPLINGEINEKSFLELTISYVLAGLDVVLKNFSAILLLLTIIAVFNMLCASFKESNLKSVFTICSTLCMAISVFGICGNLISNAAEHIKILCYTMNSFLPVMITLLTISGNISTAVMTNGSMLLFIGLVDGFLLAFMLPLTKMCLAFGCANSINSELDLSGVSKTVKNTFTSVTVFVMSLFLFILSYKSTLSQSADSISLKATRFAISSFVPLVGSSVNDALRTVSSSLSLIKNSCGIIAIIAIAVLMLPVIINLFLNKISFSFLSTIAKATNSQKEAQLLDEADSVCGFALTLVCSTSVLFIFALTIFLKTGVVQ